ncbi:HTH domain-containing protein [Candidatus Wolfebacteria bacterium]|nr:HTH domain-containing protein [Candidatus Wolfebacteria bacterium]
MTLILISIIIFLAAAVVALVVFARKEAGKHGTSVKEEFVGICASAIETASQKEARKESALAYLRSRGELSNSEIRKALGVSSRTAVRYLDELEAEGKVEQVGKIGHTVTYRLKHTA